MANAIPVHRGDPKPSQEPTKPAVPVVAEDEHSKYIGKDHPDFGRWHGHGWSQSFDKLD